MNKKDIIIILDDGHGSTTKGKRSPKFKGEIEIDGIKYNEDYEFIENIFNCNVVDYIDEIIKKEGTTCIQLAPKHEDISLNERVKLENKYFDESKKAGKKSILISIHANAHTNNWNEANGIETFCEKNSTEGFKLATVIQRNVVKDLGLRNRGVKTTPSFFITRKSKSPAVLYEGGFMTNPNEVKLLMSKPFQKKTAESIVKSIFQYFNIKE